MPAPAQEIARLQFVVREQMKEIDRLRLENERLAAACDAHGVMTSIYLDPTASQTNRVKAASSAIGYERPRLMSVVPPIELDRRTAWQTYERWRLRREIIIETHQIPPKDCDAHILADSWQPPEGDSMPPVRVVKDPTSGFRTLDSLLPGARRNGKASDDGNGSDGSSEAS